MYEVLFLTYFFPELFFHSRVFGACPVTTDSILAVDVRTTAIIMLTVAK